MKTQLKKIWLIIEAFFIIILECLIITLPIYLDLSIYVGVVVSNILTFTLAIFSANIFRKLGHMLSEPEKEPTEQPKNESEVEIIAEVKDGSKEQA